MTFSPRKKSGHISALAAGALCVLLALGISASASVSADSNQDKKAAVSVDGSLIGAGNTNSQSARDKKETYIVVLKDTSLARYRGGVPGYKATSNSVSGARKLDARSADSVKYLSYLADRRAVAINSAEAIIGRSLDISYQYGATIVGFAAGMTAPESERIAALDQVAWVEKEEISTLHTDAGPAWSDAPNVWEGNWNGRIFPVEMSGS